MIYNTESHRNVVASVAQLVRASACGAEGRGFESHRSPQNRRE